MNKIDREKAWQLLLKYNSDPFHIQHALTVEGVMNWFSQDLGYGQDADYWGTIGLLHDIDFERYPDAHCIKAPDLLRDGGFGKDVIHAVCSHGYQLTVDVKPEHEMEKVLYATDELIGLIWAVAILRPSQSVQDIEVKSVKKKYKCANFAAGCSRRVIETGAAMLDWNLDYLIEKTILAMRFYEFEINEKLRSSAISA